MNLIDNPKRVLVTRPEHQAAQLCELLHQQQIQTVLLPTIAIQPIDDATRIKQCLANLNHYDWLIFVSSNAVTMLYYHLDDGRMPHTTRTRLAAIGATTANAMMSIGLPVHLIPSHGYSSEALLATAEMQQVNKQTILIVRGEGGLEDLAAILRARGAHVDYLAVYKRVTPKSDTAIIDSLLQQQQLDALTITSVEALNNLLVMLPPTYHQRLFALPLIVLSDRIKQAALAIGFKQIIVATEANDKALAAAVTECLTGE